MTIFLNMIFAPVARAVPPPDFIFSIASNMGIVLAFTAAFLGSLFVSLRNYLTVFLHTTRGRLALASIFIVLCGGVVYGYSAYSAWQQERSYAEWIKESNAAKQAEQAEEALVTPTPTANVVTAASPTSVIISSTPTPSQSATPSFFESNKTISRMVSNIEFSQILKSSSPYVLDAREDEENRYGHFPDSHHIRSADITAGAWTTLPQDQVIYVLCWSGIRGKEVADFLYGQGLVARYLEGGADGWVSYGGVWEGGIKFDKIHPEERYHLVLETEQVKSAMDGGAFIVDSRPVKTYTRWHIPGSVNLPIIYTPTDQLPTAFAQIPVGSSIITVCDDFVSCFDARLTGLKAEQDRQVTFMGRYAKPWDYRGKYP